MPKFFTKVAKELGYKVNAPAVEETIKNKLEYNKIKGQEEYYVNLVNLVLTKRLGFYVEEVQVKGEDPNTVKIARSAMEPGGENIIRTLALTTFLTEEAALCLDFLNMQSYVRGMDSFVKMEGFSLNEGVFLQKVLFFAGQLGEQELYMEYVQLPAGVEGNVYAVGEREFKKTLSKKISYKKIPVNFFTQINTIDKTTQKRPLASYLINYNLEFNKLKEYAQQTTELSAVPITALVDMENGENKINSVRPGALWDLQSVYGENKSGKVERITGDSNFLKVLEDKKREILGNMYLAASLPNPYSTAQITTTSGKALTIQYWELLGEVNDTNARWGRTLAQYINNIAGWEGNKKIRIEVISTLGPLLELEFKKDKLEEIRMGIRSKKSYALEQGLDWELEKKRMEEENYNEDDPLNF